MGMASFFSVYHLSLVGFTKELNETGIDVCGRGDPFVVGWGKAGGVVDPGPHYCAGAEGEKEGGSMVGNCFGGGVWEVV